MNGARDGDPLLHATHPSNWPPTAKTPLTPGGHPIASGMDPITKFAYQNNNQYDQKQAYAAAAFNGPHAAGIGPGGHMGPGMAPHNGLGIGPGVVTPSAGGPQQPMTPEDEFKMRQAQRKWRKDWLALKIDAISQFMFPFLFILFNLFYWYYYMDYMTGDAIKSLQEEAAEDEAHAQLVGEELF